MVATPLYGISEWRGHKMAQSRSSMIYIGCDSSVFPQPVLRFPRFCMMTPDHPKCAIPSKPLPPSLTSITNGMWRIIYDRETSSMWSRAYLKLKQTFLDRNLVRLFVDIYSIGPGLLLLCTVCHLVRGVEDACAFYYSTRLLSAVCSRHDN